MSSNITIPTFVNLSALSIGEILDGKAKGPGAPADGSAQSDSGDQVHDSTPTASAVPAAPAVAAAPAVPASPAVAAAPDVRSVRSVRTGSSAVAVGTPEAGGKPTRSLQELLAGARARGKKPAGEGAQNQAGHAGQGDQGEEIKLGLQLPLWPLTVRGVPNGVLRSALFSALGRGKRTYIKGEKIRSLDGIDIHYKGERLDQGDLDVWETILHVVRVQSGSLGSNCTMRSYALLRLMGKADTGGNREILQSRIERLVANALTIKQGRYTYIGSLIEKAFQDSETQEWVIVINRELRLLFEADQFTRVDWAVRHALEGKPLAQWLHGFYASHEKPHPMKVGTLLDLAGSENKHAGSAKQSLRKAMDALTQALTANGQRFSYHIDGDLVRVSTTVAPLPALSKPQRGKAAKAAKADKAPKEPEESAEPEGD